VAFAPPGPASRPAQGHGAGRQCRSVPLSSGDEAGRGV
jgi:hypothetical protein